MQVESIPVTIYANIVGFFPEGISVNLDCSARKIENDTINTTVGGACMRLEPGGVWPNGAPDGFDTVNTVKLNTPDGFVWMKAADYDTFISKCNGCCVNN